MYDDAIVNARHATEKDPQSALSYALLSFVARRGVPNSAALAKAKSLLPRSTSDEQLLVRWMTSIQERELLPAIMNMNDLLKHYPRDKHVLYLTAEWLYFQQDYDRARTMMETALQIDPKFPAVLNRLGYVYAEAGEIANAVASLKRYAEVEPGSLILRTRSARFCEPPAMIAVPWSITVRLCRSIPPTSPLRSDWRHANSYGRFQRRTKRI